MKSSSASIKLIKDAQIILLLLTFFTVSCVSHPVIPLEEDATIPKEYYVCSNYNWNKIRDGLETADFYCKEFPVRYHLTKIDLTTPGISIKYFPDESVLNSENETNEYERIVFKGIKTSEFARRFKTALAVNTTPFGGRNSRWDLEAKLGSIRTIVGVHKFNGIQFASPVKQYAALVLDWTDSSKKFLKAGIIDSQTEEILAPYPFAFGGFYTILRDGQIQSFKANTHDSRMACGIKDEGRTIIFLAVEGEFSSSEGLSFPQCAEIFESLGCSCAMEFDGGSSTQMYIGTKSVLSYNFSVVQGSSIGFVFN